MEQWTEVWTVISIIFEIIIYFSWSYGLLLHQGLVDLARSAILIPLGKKSFSKSTLLNAKTHIFLKHAFSNL